ncbi:hypothetical protein HJG44_04510 [Enterovirga sp. DB1703]|uniref:Uncharacterized protein n=2 Tax=Enterovirga aerilata TaxID=2730920 RepID=A0A849I6D9_9HYPH|nr:hypothetical protein [Enterovirga sp. DB1703]
MTADLQVEVPVTKGGAPGGVLYRSRDEFLAACPEIRARVGELELVSALGDRASASLVLRDGTGELLTLLLAFDPDGRITRIASFRRSRPLAAGLRAPM